MRQSAHGGGHTTVDINLVSSAVEIVNFYSVFSYVRIIRLFLSGTNSFVS